MRITFLLTQSLESPSGLGRYWPLARELAKLGHTTRIVALHPNLPEKKQRQFEADGVLVDYVAPMHVMKIGNEKTYYSIPKLIQITAGATVKLSQNAISIPSDILYVSKPHPMNSIAGILGKSFSGKRLIIDCDDYEAESNRFSGRWQKQIIAWFEKNAPRMGALITTNTFFMRDKLLGWGIPMDRIFYLPNGIDRERFTPPPIHQVKDLKLQLGIDGKKIVIYIGTLSLPSHPIDILIQAFVEVHQKYPESVLLLVGGGEDFAFLKGYVNDIGLDNAVFFIGRVEPDLVPIYYRLADVSVDPVHDNDAARGRCPLKLFESWSCGIPFVTAEVGDRRRLLGSPPAGTLAQPGNSHSLAQAILGILNNRQTAIEIVERGVLRVENYYWDQLTGNAERMFAGVL